MRVIGLEKDNVSLVYKVALDYLRKDKVLILPTDTIDGFSARASNRAAIAKIFKIKKRDRSKPLLVLVSSMAMIKRYCYLNKKQELKLKEIFLSERPSSILLRHRNLLAPNLTALSPYLAVRLPKNIFLRKMIKELGEPLASTSVNSSGERSLSALEFIESNKKAPLPDLVILNSKKKNSSLPSRLISLNEKAEIKILRK